MKEMTLMEKINESPAVEKSALIVAGTTLLSTGIALVEKQPVVSIILVILGVSCLVFREIRKLV